MTKVVNCNSGNRFKKIFEEKVTMKARKLIIFSLCLASITLAGCNEAEIQSQWTETNTLDDINFNWPEAPQYFDENSKNNKRQETEFQLDFGRFNTQRPAGYIFRESGCGGHLDAESGYAHDKTCSFQQCGKR